MIWMAVLLFIDFIQIAMSREFGVLGVYLMSLRVSYGEYEEEANTLIFRTSSTKSSMQSTHYIDLTRASGKRVAAETQ